MADKALIRRMRSAGYIGTMSDAKKGYHLVRDKYGEVRQVKIKRSEARKELNGAIAEFNSLSGYQKQVEAYRNKMRKIYGPRYAQEITDLPNKKSDKMEEKA